MHRGLTFFLFFLYSIFTASAQPGKDFSIPDAIARSAPDSVERSVSLLYRYFSANLSASKDLVRAFYTWTATEISYDVENMFNIKPVDNAGRLILQTLETRKAVCQGYAEVFFELCNLAGIECYKIQGYCKQNGVVMSLSHTWILAVIDSTWSFFDPTWGSGYVMNGKFTPKFNNEYFMVPPARLIKSHMPFDPVWQCLVYPYNASDFYNGTAPKPDPARFFAFADTIHGEAGLDKTARFTASLRRVEQNGVVNNNIGEYLRYLRQSLEVDRLNRENDIRNDMVNRFNTAVNHYNAASLLFNTYINYWNRQFKPVKPDAEIRQMIDTCNTQLTLCLDILAGINPTEETLMQNLALFRKTVEDLRKKTEEQSAFMMEYIGTPRALRPALFRKYTF